MKKLILAVLLLISVAVFAAAEYEVPILYADATSWIVGKDPNAYTPQKMIDGIETTSFQFSTSATPLGQEYIWFYLSSPSDLDTLWIKNGFWKKTDGKDQYTRNCRIKTMKVDFQFSGSNAFTEAITVTLPDDATRRDWTKISLGTKHAVTCVRLQPLTVYTGTAFPHDVCISEVKFMYGSGAAPSGELYGLATVKLATRSGPGTNYSEQGTYEVAGQYIRVLSRAWDKNNEIWWVKCEIPYRGQIRVLWTGYKRFDPSTLPLESIPIEGEAPSGQQITPGSNSGPADAADGWTHWSAAYEDFVMNRRYLSSGQEYDTSTQGWYEISFGLHDMDADSVPELIISNGVDYMAGRTNHVYTFRNGSVIYIGDAGFRESQLHYYQGSSYPGLFCVDGNMGYYYTVYYTVRGLSVAEETVLIEQLYSDDDPYTELDTPEFVRQTQDQALYDLVSSPASGITRLILYSREEISALGGWQGFLNEVLSGASWQRQYQAFLLSGSYLKDIHNPDPQFDEIWEDRELYGATEYFALHDINRDGTPELIIGTDYGVEQADIFTFSGGSVQWLGTMGGYNFFQYIFSYDDPRYPALFAAMGGPAMEIEAYTVDGGQLKKTTVGRTRVNADGEDTGEIDMALKDENLRQLLEGTFRGGDEDTVYLYLYSRTQLQSDADWEDFFSQW